MTRILLTLASISMIGLVAALVLGFAIGDLYAKPLPSLETLHRATLHRLTGVAAALIVVLVESVIVTYFIGTSRWCKEVVETYQLDPAAVQASNRLKRRTFPWALVGMLAVVGIVALGGANDPANGWPNAKDWAYWHLLGATLGLPLIAWTYLVAWNNIAANQAIIQNLVEEVGQIRRERGLDMASGGPGAADEANAISNAGSGSQT
jgi:hypothetical protein